MIRKTLAVAALLVALAGPAFAASPEPLSRQEMTDIGACAYTTGIFLQSLEDGNPTDADRALAEQTKDAIVAVGGYYDRLGRPFDDKLAAEMADQFRPPINDRLRRYDSSADRGGAVRDEFRADMQACLAKFQALVPADDKSADGK